MSLEATFSTIRSARRVLTIREAEAIAQARAQGWTEKRIARAIGGRLRLVELDRRDTG